MFGSLARNEAIPGSDADILIVVDASERPFAERPSQYQIEGCGIGIDMLVYTRAELERMRAEGSPFLRQIEGEGYVLWQR